MKVVKRVKDAIIVQQVAYKENANASVWIFALENVIAYTAKIFLKILKKSIIKESYCYLKINLEEKNK